MNLVTWSVSVDLTGVHEEWVLAKLWLTVIQNAVKISRGVHCTNIVGLVREELNVGVLIQPT